MKKGSLAVTFLMPTARLPQSISIILSTRRKGKRWGMIFWISTLLRVVGGVVSGWSAILPPGVWVWCRLPGWGGRCQITNYELRITRFDYGSVVSPFRGHRGDRGGPRGGDRGRVRLRGLQPG